MRTLHTLLSLLCLAAPAFATTAASDSTVPQQPTFFEDVLPILQANCQTCHRHQGENIGGMIAPMPLFTYDEVRPWAKSMARVVLDREMPPWFASDDTRGQFHGERRLSEAEIETLVRWSRTGAGRGDSAHAPPPVQFADEAAGGWTNGPPDLVVSLPQPFFVADDVEDLNINFTHTLSQEQLPEDTFVRGIEFKVGGTFVHHMCAFLRTDDRRVSSAGEFTRNSLGCIALGAEPTLFPEGYGLLLPKGATIAFSMHYHKEPGEGSGRWDQSQLAFVFNDKPVRHRVRYTALPNMHFEVPPGHDRWVVGSAHTFAEDTTLLALWPHAHLRAVAARYTAHYPDGTRELLLDVPRYDQEWQTTYRYVEPKRVPAGTRLEAKIWYDNSEERAAERGFDAAQRVRFGPRTTDEMMLGFFNYTHTEPIDFAAEPERLQHAALVPEVPSP